MVWHRHRRRVPTFAPLHQYVAAPASHFSEPMPCQDCVDLPTDSTRSLANRCLHLRDMNLIMKPTLNFVGGSRLVKELKRFLEIGASLGHTRALACDVQLGAEGDVGFSFALDNRGHMSQHGLTFWLAGSQTRKALSYPASSASVPRSESSVADCVDPPLVAQKQNRHNPPCRLTKILHLVNPKRPLQHLPFPVRQPLLQHPDPLAVSLS